MEGETIIDAGRDGADIVEVISVELSIGIGPNATGNGNDGIGVVQDWSLDAAGSVAAIIFLVDGASEPLTIGREFSFPESYNGLQGRRLMFPLIPAHAVTVHRVQGATIAQHDLHILLNKEHRSASRRRETHLDAVRP